MATFSSGVRKFKVFRGFSTLFPEVRVMATCFSRVRSLGVLCGAVVCAGLFLGSTAFADNNFTATTGQWNDVTKWSAGHVPNATNEIVGIVGPSSTVTYDALMGTLTFGNAAKEFRIGDGRLPSVGSNPTNILNVTGGTLNHNVASETIVGYGFLQPCNSYLNVSGAGQFLTSGILTLGWLGKDASNLSNGYLNLSTGGTASASTLTVGSGPFGVGYLDVAATGGTFTVPTIRIGYDNATGHATQEGGTVTASGSLIIGTGIASPAGHLLGGGDYTLSGGTLKALTISNTANLGPGGVLKLNGGTLQAYSTSANWIQNSTKLSVLVQNGGAIIDSNGAANAIISQALLEDATSLGGGLDKLGPGKITLANLPHTYTGNTKVENGTLSISNTYLADASNVLMTTGATFDLNYTGTDTINSLLFDNVAQAAGTWGAVGSAAVHQSGFFTGTGLLLVTVPEPSTIALLAMGLLGLIAYAWRKRK